MILCDRCGRRASERANIKAHEIDISCTYCAEPGNPQLISVLGRDGDCDGPLHDKADAVMEMEQLLRDLVNFGPWHGAPRENCPWCYGDEEHDNGCLLERARAALRAQPEAKT